MSMESQVKCCCPQSISGDLQQKKSIAAPEQLRYMGTLKVASYSPEVSRSPEIPKLTWKDVTLFHCDAPEMFYGP